MLLEDFLRFGIVFSNQRGRRERGPLTFQASGGRVRLKGEPLLIADDTELTLAYQKSRIILSVHEICEGKMMFSPSSWGGQMELCGQRKPRRERKESIE